jgi:hypothetical protein
MRAQRSHDRRTAVARTHAVDQHAYHHATLHRTRERVDEVVRDLTAVEDVGGQANAARRAVDGGEHRRVGRIAVQQQVHRISRREFHSGHCAHHCTQWSKRRRDAGWQRRLAARRRLGTRRVGPTERSPQAHPSRLAADAIQSE